MSTPPQGPEPSWPSTPPQGNRPQGGDQTLEPGPAQPYQQGQACPGQTQQAQPYPPGPYPQVGPDMGGHWGYPAAPGGGLPIPAGPTAVHWPGKGTVAIPHLGSRLVARLIDVVIVFVGAALLGGLVAGLTSLLDGGSGEVGWVNAIRVVLLILVALVGPVLYEIGLLATKGATLGKRMMGLRVVRSENAGLLGWGRATGRYLVPHAGVVLPLIGALFLMLCYVSPAFDSSGRRQGWHDRAAGTVVIAPG
jgi:uncharacterized RDD family membrane protein YckC